MHTPGSIPDVLNQNIWGQGPGICRADSPWAESDAAYSEERAVSSPQIKFRFTGVCGTFCSKLTNLSCFFFRDYHRGTPHPSISSSPGFQNTPHTLKPSWSSFCRGSALPFFSTGDSLLQEPPHSPCHTNICPFPFRIFRCLVGNIDHRGK